MTKEDYADKNFILFLCMYPEGLKYTEIILLFRKFSEWFGG